MYNCFANVFANFPIVAYVSPLQSTNLYVRYSQKVLTVETQDSRGIRVLKGYIMYLGVICHVSGKIKHLAAVHNYDNV